MTTLRWADKVFTASLLVKNTVFTVSLTPMFQFFHFLFLLFHPSPHMSDWKKQKNKGCSVNTVGSLLMLEPDDGVVRELKDKDKDRKNWELGKNRRWLITSRTPERLRGQEKSICGQKENPMGLFYFSKPCTVAWLDPSNFSTPFINPGTGKAFFPQIQLPFWMEGQGVRKRWSCGKNKKKNPQKKKSRGEELRLWVVNRSRC